MDLVIKIEGMRKHAVVSCSEDIRKLAVRSGTKIKLMRNIPNRRRITLYNPQRYVAEELGRILKRYKGTIEMKVEEI